MRPWLGDEPGALCLVGPRSRSPSTSPRASQRSLSPTHVAGPGAQPLAGGERGRSPPATRGPDGTPCPAWAARPRSGPSRTSSRALCSTSGSPPTRGHEAARNKASSAVTASAAGAWSGKLVRSPSRGRWGCHMTVPTEGEGPHDGGRVRDRPAGESVHPATNYRGSAPKSPAGAAPRTRDVHGGPQRCVRGVVHDVLAGGRPSPRPASWWVPASRYQPTTSNT